MCTSSKLKTMINWVLRFVICSLLSYNLWRVLQGCRLLQHPNNAWILCHHSYIAALYFFQHRGISLLMDHFLKYYMIKIMVKFVNSKPDKLINIKAALKYCPYLRQYLWKKFLVLIENFEYCELWVINVHLCRVHEICYQRSWS